VVDADPDRSSDPVVDADKRAIAHIYPHAHRNTDGNTDPDRNIDSRSIPDLDGVAVAEPDAWPCPNPRLSGTRRGQLPPAPARF
jgi:hypothetical protein